MCFISIVTNIGCKSLFDNTPAKSYTCGEKRLLEAEAQPQNKLAVKEEEDTAKSLFPK